MMIANSASVRNLGVCEQVCVRQFAILCVSHYHATCVSVVQEAEPPHCAPGVSYRLLAGAGRGQGSRWSPDSRTVGCARLSAHQAVS